MQSALPAWARFSSLSPQKKHRWRPSAAAAEPKSERRPIVPFSTNATQAKPYGTTWLNPLGSANKGSNLLEVVAETLLATKRGGFETEIEDMMDKHTPTPSLPPNATRAKPYGTTRRYRMLRIRCNLAYEYSLDALRIELMGSRM